jgi:hypothetical protein
MKFRFRETVLIELARHGIIPREDTPPELVHQFVSDLHLFEIRRLRERFISGLIPKADYAATVEAVTKRYPILALPVRFWTKDNSDEQ